MKEIGNSMDHLKWKVRNRKTLVTSPWISVNEEVVHTNKGTVIDPFYTIDEPNWAAVVAFTPSNKVVLNIQYRHGCKRVNWELPGGCVEEHEQQSPNAMITTALRELKEETGYDVDDSKPIVDLGPMTPDPNRNSSVAHGFLCRLKSEQPESEQSLDQSEEIHTVLMDIEEVYNRFCVGQESPMSPIHVTYLFRAFAHLNLLKFDARGISTMTEQQ